MSYFDNPTALGQLEKAVKYIVSRNATMQHDRRAVSKSGVHHPRPIVLGGDHTITLSVLRAVAEIYGPVTLIHFDSHLDSCDLVSTLAQKILIGLQGKPHFAPPDVPPAEQPYTHGSMLWLAAQEGLITKSSIHAGIRTRLKSADDYRQDRALGFEIIHADEIEDIGYKGIVRKIRDRVQGTPVYSKRARARLHAPRLRSFFGHRRARPSFRTGYRHTRDWRMVNS
jgi:agmatinase